MKKLYIAIGAIFLIVAGAVVFWPKQKVETLPSLAASPNESFETQTNSEGDIVVIVTPKDAAAGIFEVTLDTHSIELSDDFTEVSILRDENGKEYKPISWEGSPAGGHHREGLLNFGKLSPKPRKIELIIRGIGGIAERRFLWITQP